MQIFNNVAEIKKYLSNEKAKNATIGLVPTMGYLHEGHCSLVEKSIDDNDITVVSIFVNPTQFGAGEDYDKYPRDTKKDLELLKTYGTQVIFCPSVEEMYPEDFNTTVEVSDITQGLCGASRPGHFKGVTTIVTKLLNIVNPTKAYFGQKDAQQALVIRQMVKDLNMDAQIVISPIIREMDGLAMSSRNIFLDKDQRHQATVLFKSLQYAKGLYDSGEKSTEKIKSSVEKIIKSSPLVNIDYISIVDISSLKPVEEINSKCLLALAVKFGPTRLIDNIILE